MLKRFASYIPVLFVTLVALMLGFFDAQKHPGIRFFSDSSLESMKALNYEYEISIKDLTATQDSPLMSELLKADVLLPEQSINRENKGILVSVDTSSAGSKLLLLQPVNELSDSELGKIAETYKQFIPEFINVELDQDISLESIVYDWELFPSEDLGIDLSSKDEPVKVAVIDSGIDTTHEIFADSQIKTGWNTIKDDNTMYDDVGHGTHIAGLIAMHASSAEIYPYKIVDSKGGRLSNVLSAFSHAIDDDVDLINTSFGLSSSSYALNEIVNDAYEKGIIVVSAAGNNGADTPFYPAYLSHTIAVASVDNGENRMSSSNFGDWVDVASYGYHVRSSLPNNLYGYKSGTSQATAVVSGVIAKMLAESSKDMSFEDVLAKLQSSELKVSQGELAGLPIIK